MNDKINFIDITLDVNGYYTLTLKNLEYGSEWKDEFNWAVYLNKLNGELIYFDKFYYDGNNIRELIDKARSSIRQSFKSLINDLNKMKI